MVIGSTQELEFPCEMTTNDEADLNNNFKTELCRNWSLGLCQWGNKCSFAHGYEELRERKVIKANYRTKRCKQFHQLGFCIYGNRCQFIHKEQMQLQDGETSRKRLPVFVSIEKRGDCVD
jgi:hypothetical protein